MLIRSITRLRLHAGGLTLTNTETRRDREALLRTRSSISARWRGRGIGHSGISEAKRENKLSSAVFLICGTRQFDGWHGTARIQASHVYPHGSCVMASCQTGGFPPWHGTRKRANSRRRKSSVTGCTRSDYLNVPEYQWTRWTGQGPHEIISRSGSVCTR